MASTVALLSQSIVLPAGGGGGSATVVEHPPAAQHQQQQPAQQQQQQQASTSGAVAEHLVLRLVPKKKKKGKGVRWAEDVVDNEFAGKRKSKKCCIFHRQRQFGEWSDEEDSDAECDCPDGEQPAGSGQPPQQQPSPA
ncbi:phosphatase 1 regulatory subunit 11-like [Micractinium conductrix]|uniref:Phosphatase 1 regulatory subunit 11-like n=1 Tax=Micractinium conductrix TaxID=554055 RepID=A0A2P6VAQ9_9CHLO|nr:phosphatase 1 regulatory subunit 11-like [Micractinium conductrix]|eukprot:PSC71173.1 phosphatase 1 regulatory subunit 11-like [Micractinium conductrix]